MDNAKNLVLFGGIGLMVGAALPWGTVTSAFGQISMNGLEGDGMLSGGAGLVLLLVALTVKPKAGSMFSVLGGIVALFAGYISLNAILNVGSLADEPGVIVQTGYGLYVSLIGALLATLGSFSKIPGEPAAENNEQPAPQETSQAENKPLGKTELIAIVVGGVIIVGFIIAAVIL